MRPDIAQTHPPTQIAALVAAAGRSLRMGEPKQLLAWGDSTVLAAVTIHLAQAGAAPVVCVVGHRGAEMRAALGDAPTRHPIEVIDNPAYLTGEMLSSYQTGIRRLLARPDPCPGTLLALGDQPHIPVSVIRQVIDQAQATPDQIVIPSYTLRRGHPFYLPRRLWQALIALPEGETLRDLVRRHNDAIVYVNVQTDAILFDIDTPADYQQLRPTAPHK
jgi:molybdenum cofactor cytidylyltransferase